MRRAKIVATLGPAAASYEQIRALIDAGVDVCRMNLSHGNHQVHEGVYANVRKAANDSGRAVAVMVDLQGLAPSSPDWVWARLVRRPRQPITGSPEEIAAQLKAYTALGISRVHVWLDPPGVEGVEAFAPVLDLLAAG